MRVQLSRLIWLAIGVIEALLGFRILFKLISANPNAGFVQLIYRTSGWLRQPLQGFAASPQLAGGLFDLPAVIALMAYLEAGSLLVQLLRALLPAQIKEPRANQA